jgi:hypothetical protein
MQQAVRRRVIVIGAGAAAARMALPFGPAFAQSNFASEARAP